MNQSERNVIIPTIHTNGSSAESLIDAYMAAYHAVGKAQEAMRQATPNARDYYIRGDDVALAAREQHAAHQSRLSDLRDDLEKIIIGIQDQDDERKAARERRRNAAS